MSAKDTTHPEGCACEECAQLADAPEPNTEPLTGHDHGGGHGQHHGYGGHMTGQCGCGSTLPMIPGHACCPQCQPSAPRPCPFPGLSPIGAHLSVLDHMHCPTALQNRDFSILHQNQLGQFQWSNGSTTQPINLKHLQRPGCAPAGIAGLGPDGTLGSYTLDELFRCFNPPDPEEPQKITGGAFMAAYAIDETCPLKINPVPGYLEVETVNCSDYPVEDPCKKEIVPGLYEKTEICCADGTKQTILRPVTTTSLTSLLRCIIEDMCRREGFTGPCPAVTEVLGVRTDGDGVKMPYLGYARIANLVAAIREDFQATGGASVPVDGPGPIDIICKTIEVSCDSDWWPRFYINHGDEQWENDGSSYRFWLKVNGQEIGGRTIVRASEGSKTGPRNYIQLPAGTHEVCVCAERVSGDGTWYVGSVSVSGGSQPAG